MPSPMARIVVFACLLALGACEVKEITVYRITPRNYTGIRNFDTGDAGGDSFFGLYELATPIICSGGSNAGVTCTNVPILQIPGFNVYTENIVEVDTRYGDYSECNPDPNNGTFACGHFQRSGCWNKNPKYKDAFKGICSASECECDVVETKAVGMKYPLTFGPPPNPKNSTLPPQCKADFFSLPSVAVNATPFTTTTTDLASCCSSCTPDSTPSCSVYTYKKDTLHKKKGTCELFHIDAGFPAFLPNPAAESGFYNSQTPTQKSVMGHIDDLANALDGSWYSTRAEGECKEGQTLGSGDCWWKLSKVTRNINATCVNNNLIDNVKQTRPQCWDACPQPTNMTSDCWILCLFETLAGNKTKGIKPMTKAQIVEPFLKSFASADPKKGGCVEVPPCPSPCKPSSHQLSLAEGQTGLSLSRRARSGYFF